MEVKITSVYDEGSLEGTQLIGAKGFAVLVEAGGKRVLFDTGLRDRYLLHNLNFLDVEPDSIDAVVVSQAFPDNSRGLDGFLKARENPVDVYAPAGIYEGKKGFLSGSVGISDENRPKAVLHGIGEDWTEIFPGIVATPAIVSDDGYREVFLVAEGPLLTVISGRGYGGPRGVVEAVSKRYNRNVRAFVGGILLEKKKKPVAEEYAIFLRDNNVTELYLNHDTGRDGMTNLRVHLGLKAVNDFYVGSTFNCEARM